MTASHYCLVTRRIEASMGNVAPHERDARATGYDRSALRRHDSTNADRKTAAACAPVSRDERLFNAVAIDCIDDLFDMTPAVERKRVRAKAS
jgi:hypothetical protein